jgi:hypothetical protein
MEASVFGHAVAIAISAPFTEIADIVKGIKGLLGRLD